MKENKRKENFIVIASSVPFPYGNASDNIIFTFMSGFKENGCKGEVVCLYPNLPSKYSDVKPIGEYKGVEYRYLCGRTGKTKNKLLNYLNTQILPDSLFRKYLKEKTKDYQVIVIFINHVHKKFFKLSKVCHNLGARVVFTACEYPEFLIERNEQKELLFKEYAKYIDTYIFETKTLADYYEEALGKHVKKIIVPPTMPFDDIIEKKRKKTIPYIAYCGSIHSEEKDGLSNIIEAFKQFHNNFANVKLRFVGRVSKESYFKKLMEKVTSLDLIDCVDFTGEVNREEYVEQLVNATMLMVAKPKSSYYGGGLSSKVIEYLFSGNPVMMVDSDDYVDYLTHKQNVFFVGDNNPKTLSEGMLYLFEHPEQLSVIGKGGKDYAENHFNYHILCKELLSYLIDTNV